MAVGEGLCPYADEIKLHCVQARSLLISSALAYGMLANYHFPALPQYSPFGAVARME